jgi:hypothetical protein
VSEVVDSANSYWSNSTYRTVFYPKYIAANMFTFYPYPGLNISFGNSIVYCDLGGPHLAYLIPFLFYKSVDHTLNATYDKGESGQNSQMFFSISSRNIRYLHLYFSIFADDLSVYYFTNKEEYNHFSYKSGFRLSNYPVQNTSITTEFTHTNPYVYQHKIATQTYESNEYNMGHYLRDNSRELFIRIGFKPIRGIDIALSYTLAQHGDDHDKTACANDPGCELHKGPILDTITWEQNMFCLKTSYQVLAGTYLYISYQYAEMKGNDEYYIPEYYRGITSTIRAGFNIGF